MNCLFAILAAVTISFPDKPAKLTDPVVFDKPNMNRNQNSGPIFYVNKQKQGPFKVILTCKTARRGQLTDGKAPNLVLRVFSPEDKSIAAATIDGKPQTVKTAVVDLSDAPVGRYRLSLVGWFHSMAIKTEPATDGIGIAGGYTLGLYPDKTYYLYLTGTKVELKAATLAWPKTKHTIVIKDYSSGKILADKEIVNSRYKFTNVDLKGLKPGSLLSVAFTGKKPGKLIINDTVPILWTTPKAALASKGDQIKAGNRMVSHAWQKPLAEWLQNRKKEDFAISDLKAPKVDLKDPKYRNYVVNINWDFLIPVAKNMMQENQITDPKNKNLGLFKDAKTKKYEFKQLGYALTIMELYKLEMAGLNPYYNNEQVKNRALAALFQCLLMVPENQLTTFDFVLIKFLGAAADGIGNDIKDEKLREAFKDGVLEFMSRNAYFDGYQSNQGLNVILGLRRSLNLTKDKILTQWYERYMNAFFNDQFVDVNHGQTPEGFYQESGGLDGGYNSYSNQLMLELWLVNNKDDKYLQSLKKNFLLLRYLSVTHPEKGYTSSRQWNTRTARAAWGNHSLRAGHAIPECVTFIKRGNTVKPDINYLAQTLPSKLNGPFKKNELESRKFWAGYGAVDLDYLSADYAEPEKLLCEIPGDFIKKIGRKYLIAKQGDYYAVFFCGDQWHVGDAGSGLANLWHKDFGSLILGDTLQYKKNKKQIISFCETWLDAKGQNASSFRSSGDITQKGNEIILKLKTRKKRRNDRDVELIRTFSISAKGLASTAVNNDKVWKDHILYLPLVSNKIVKLEVLNNKKEVVKVSADKPVKASAFRWTNQKGAVIELNFDGEFDVSLHTKIKCQRDYLNIMKIIFGNKQGKFNVRRLEK